MDRVNSANAPARDIIKVAREERKAMLEDGEIIPIFGYLNAEGDMVADFDDDDSDGFVAGPCSQGKVYYDWWRGFDAAEKDH